ncbi:hypothetical protein N9V65_01755 [Flavobacteriales bacterium]|nr:hypothetical protein [Flavobacteriales bacterium]
MRYINPNTRPKLIRPEDYRTTRDDRLVMADPFGVGVDRPSLYNIKVPYDDRLTPADPLGVGGRPAGFDFGADKSSTASDQDWQQYIDAVGEQRQKRADGDLGRYIGTGEGSDGYGQFNGPQTRPVRVKPNDVPEMIDRPIQRDPGDGGSGPDGISKGYVSIPNMPLPSLDDRLTPADPLGVGKGTYDPLATPLPSSSPQQFGKGGGAPTQPQGPITGSAITGSAPTQPQGPITGSAITGSAPTQQPTQSPQPAPTQPPQVYDPLATPLPTQQYAGGAVVRQMAGGGSTYTSEPPMSGLSSVLAMQGRLGDSTLVHMNPMEVEMLKTMSPDGRLSINPETGLPEAFKLRDLAAFALPIAASIAFPMLAPSIGLGGLSGVATGAIGAGLGGVGAGLIQGKGVGDSLIQGGLSGLMSYGLGSAFAPAAPGGNIPTASPSQSQIASLPTDMAGTATAFEGGFAPAAAETPGVFGRLTDFAQKPFMPETLSNLAPEGYAASLAAGAAPTYGSALTAGGSGLLSSALLAPEEMPYDIDGMADMDAYYNSRIPDLEAGRRRGRAAARSLNYPPSGGSAADYYRMATSPGGFGTFYAAEGGLVPNAYGDTYGDPYGPGNAYGGVADASNTSGTPGSAGTSGLGSFGNSIDMGLGVANPSPMGIAASLAGLALGIPGLGPAVAIGRGIAGLMGQSVPGQVSGYGTTTAGPQGIGMTNTGKGVDPGYENVSEGYGGTGMGGEDSGSGDQGDTGVGHGAGEGTSEEGGGVSGWAQGGGIASLAYGGNPPPADQAFEGMVPGNGTGMSDDIPFSIEGNQPALLSRDEYVLPADVVSQLGDGSSGAGSDMLDNFISQVRQTKYGNTQQPPPIGPQLMTGLMRSGGIV